MKRNLLALFCCLISICTWAQKNNNTIIPHQIAQQFSKRFNNVQEVEWTAAADKNYEARFFQNGIKKTAIFSDSGQWLQIENPVSADQLPVKVNQALARDFAGYQISHATRMELFGKGVAFRVRIRKGNGIFDVEIDVNGRVGRQVEVREREYDNHDHHHDHHHDHDDCHHCHHHHDKHKHKNKHKHKHHDHDDCDHDDD